MEEQKKDSSIEALYLKGTEYIETRLELAKLKATNTASDIGSSIISKVVIAIFILLFLIMINFGVAIWIGNMVGKSYCGFFIVGGFYGLLALVFYFFRNSWIKTPVSNSIIKKMTR
ncbi:MAG TPA: phage holin family protein [Ferruginibacter sp.]|nr:phage holin family protein [Ferruginibacter sp.]HRE63520.1 phage holin family protein [Ferruginibacter sp.]